MCVCVSVCACVMASGMGHTTAGRPARKREDQLSPRAAAPADGGTKGSLTSGLAGRLSTASSQPPSDGLGASFWSDPSPWGWFPAPDGGRRLWTHPPSPPRFSTPSRIRAAEPWSGRCARPGDGRGRGPGSPPPPEPRPLSRSSKNRSDRLADPPAAGLLSSVQNKPPPTPPDHPIEVSGFAALRSWGGG